MAFTLGYGAALLLALALTFGAWRRTADLQRLERVGLALLPLLLWLAAAAVGVNVVNARNNGWNAARLAPGAALWYGCRPYYSPEEGPAAGNMYGPISSLFYAPAGAITTPIAAVAVATTQAVLIFFLPVALLLLATVGRESRLHALYGFMAFAFLTLASDALHFAAFQVHADAPALGFAVLAVTVLTVSGPCRLAYLAASVLVVLAVWTKLPIVGVIPALLLAVALIDSWRAAGSFGLWLAGVGLCLSALIVFLCRPEAAVFNVFVVPAAHPWGALETFAPTAPPCEFFPDGFSQRAAAFGRAARDFLIQSVVIVLPLTICVSLLHKYDGAAEHNRRALRFARLALMLAAVFCLPLAIAARAKVGGDLDNLSFSLYFVAALAGLQVGMLLQRMPAWRGRGCVAVAAGAVLALVIWGTRNAPSRSVMEAVVAGRPLPETFSEKAHRYAMQRPGTAYFPWYPLAGLQAEGRLNHFASGVFEWDLAGRRISNAEFVRYLGPDVRYVCFDETVRIIPEEYFLTYLPDYQRVENVPGLEEWRVYARK